MTGGHWLYRVDAEIFGPVPTQDLSGRLASGEIPPEIYVAQNEGEFIHVSRVQVFGAALRERNDALAARRKSVRRLRWVLSALLFVVGSASAGWVVEQEASGISERQLAERTGILEKRAARAQAIAKRPLPPLEPLVTDAMLAQAQAEYTERMAKLPKKAARSKKRSSRKKKRSSQAAELSDTCKLEQQTVMRVLQKHISAITTCVDGEKTRAEATSVTLPDTLSLGFIVRPSGQVIQFEVEHASYRRGLLQKCLKKAFKKVTFPKRAGTDCPTSIPIRIPK